MGRTALAVAILLALLLRTTLAAATPLPAPGLPFVICTHDAGSADLPDGPADPHRAHSDICCTAAHIGPAVLPPSAVGLAPVFAPVRFVAQSWRARSGLAPRPPPHAQSSPRGPPRPV